MRMNTCRITIFSQNAQVLYSVAVILAAISAMPYNPCVHQPGATRRDTPPGAETSRVGAGKTHMLYPSTNRDVTGIGPGLSGRDSVTNTAVSSHDSVSNTLAK